MRLTYVSCNCMTITISKSYNRPYDHPFIGSLFVVDEQYIKFCNNFDHYLNVTPVFGPPKEDSVWAKQNGSPWYQHETINPPYPVMFLDDVEIHWIHEESTESLMQRYSARLHRYRDGKYTPVFLFSAWEMMNDHSIEEHTRLVKEFMTTPTSFFITRYPEDVIDSRVILENSWIGTDNKRNISHLYTFTALSIVERVFLKIIKESTLILREIPTAISKQQMLIKQTYQKPQQHLDQSHLTR